LAALSEHFGFGLSAEELAEFAPAVAGTMDASVAVEALYERTAGQAPQRSWESPAAEKNALGAWYVTTSINESADGPLAGRTVAVKDNISVAGVPMMNGSRTVEGFVPRRDAVVVRRLLDAGATIAGKSVCEDLCFAGGSFTSQPGPVHNPWDTSRNAGGSSSGSGALVASGEVDLALGGDQGGSIRIPSGPSTTSARSPGPSLTRPAC
jgi:amidase